MNYSDYFLSKLSQMGYSHCFFVAGGNILHLVEAARKKMCCIPVLNEYSAVIAAEYFNVVNRNSDVRAFALVTAGPGLTNCVTGIAGAWLENRALLVIGGQARSSMLASNDLKQLGHQEIKGVELVSSITKASIQITKPISETDLEKLCSLAETDPKGPVFLEVCLDVSAMDLDEAKDVLTSMGESESNDVCTIGGAEADWREELIRCLDKARRPIFLVGAGVPFSSFRSRHTSLVNIGIPIMTSWNAADYLDFDCEVYGGRCGAYGMRWSNTLVQNSDLVINLGSRLSFWETGFSWDKFAPNATIFNFNISESELKKPGPSNQKKFRVNLRLEFDNIINLVEEHTSGYWSSWREYASQLKFLLPVHEESNSFNEMKCNPFNVIDILSDNLSSTNIVIPCSSGGAYTSIMQSFRQKTGQYLLNNRGLASMGYGLAGAIGACFAMPDRDVFLVEGDGGFIQNIGEVPTVVLNQLNLKIIIFSNGGYASIRASQRNNFDGNYIGCDANTGLAIPDLQKIFQALAMPVKTFANDKELINLIPFLSQVGPCAAIIEIDPDQPYFPKTINRLSPEGKIDSEPIDIMFPLVSPSIDAKLKRLFSDLLKNVNSL